MGWQELAVAVIVGAAVLFLVRRVLGRRLKRQKPAQSFVPLSTLKKKPKRPGAGDSDCHS